MTRRALVAALVTTASCASVGCVPQPAIPALPPPTQAEWTRARARLAADRAHEPEHPYVEEIAIAMREPRTGKVFQARGALAVEPHRAMRMILVGPGGTTAVDAWVTDQRFRFVVPAIAMKRTGGADAASARGLPIGFFRWWMLHPRDGRLLAAWFKQGDPIFLLRHEGDTVLFRDHRAHVGHHVVAMRRGGGDVEELEWMGMGSMPHPGDHARYVDGATGLEVEVRVENVGDAEPDPAAFLDPDVQGTSL